ncbi:MAG: hypothetical protein JXA20_02335 [Spirochaetes bacterium]|nr:hypothetical protein [Spirochaetota bacterium]
MNMRRAAWTCAAAILMAVAAGAQEAAPPAETAAPGETTAPGKDRTAQGGRAGERRKLPCEPWNLVLGIGDLALYQTGGGDTHSNLQAASVNPLSAMTLEIFVTRGFSLGVIGSFQYLEQRQTVAILGIPQQLEIGVIAFGGGLILSYYFAVTDRFLPFVSLLSTYGKGIYKASPLYKGRSYVLDIGISGGFTYMLSRDLGIFIAVTHIRDRIDSGGAVNWGYTTGFGLGFRLFL